MINNSFRQNLEFNIDKNYILKNQLEAGLINLKDLTPTQLKVLNKIYDKEISQKMKKLNSLIN